jgi:hypothetical protein
MMGRGRVTFKLWPVLPSLTLKTTGIEVFGNDARINLGMSIKRTAEVKSPNPQGVSILVNTKVLTLVIERRATSLMGDFNWEDLEIELDDLENQGDEGR